MCSEPMIRAFWSGLSFPYLSRMAIKPGISCSAKRISARPSVARDRSRTLNGSRPAAFAASNGWVISRVAVIESFFRKTSAGKRPCAAVNSSEYGVLSRYEVRGMRYEVSVGPAPMVRGREATRTSHLVPRRAMPVPHAGLVESEADLHRHLVLGDFAVRDAAAKLDHLEPIDVTEGMGWPRHPASDCLFERLRGRADHLDELVHLVTHALSPQAK